MANDLHAVRRRRSRFRRQAARRHILPLVRRRLSIDKSRRSALARRLRSGAAFGGARSARTPFLRLSVLRSAAAGERQRRRRGQNRPVALHPRVVGSQARAAMGISTPMAPPARGRFAGSFTTATPRFSAHRIPFQSRGESGNILMRSAWLFRRLCAFQAPKPVSGANLPLKALDGRRTL